MNAQAAIVRAELAIRGWRVTDLAAHIGMNPRTVSNLICGNHRSRRSRIKIENALGMAVWSSREDFLSHQVQLKLIQKPYGSEN